MFLGFIDNKWCTGFNLLIVRHHHWTEWKSEQKLEARSFFIIKLFELFRVIQLKHTFWIIIHAHDWDIVQHNSSWRLWTSELAIEKLIKLSWSMRWEKANEFLNFYAIVVLLNSIDVLMLNISFLFNTLFCFCELCNQILFSPGFMHILLFSETHSNSSYNAKCNGILWA